MRYIYRHTDCSQLFMRKANHNKFCFQTVSEETNSPTADADMDVLLSEIDSLTSNALKETNEWNTDTDGAEPSDKMGDSDVTNEVSKYQWKDWLNCNTYLADSSHDIVNNSEASVCASSSVSISAEKCSGATSMSVSCTSGDMSV